MLRMEIDGKSAINLNEEIRNQFIEIIEKSDEEEICDEIYDIVESLKEVNYAQYCMTVKLIYKDVYEYFSYINKSNETNNLFKYNLHILSADNPDDIIEIYEKNVDLFLENFIFLLGLNNMYKAKLLLELSKEQNKHLTKLYPFHMYDLLALQDYIGYQMLEDYYLKNMNTESEDEEEPIYNPIPEELIEDIINFLDYLYLNHNEIYKKCIKEIIGKIYKWCYYYFENSVDVELDDLEIRVYNLVNGCSIDEICEKIKNTKKLLSEIFSRIFDDLEMGYPIITTKNGDKLITEPELDEYMVKTKRKQF